MDIFPCFHVKNGNIGRFFGVAPTKFGNIVLRVIILLSNCLNWKIYCDDHSSLLFTTAMNYKKKKGAPFIYLPLYNGTPLT